MSSFFWCLLGSPINWLGGWIAGCWCLIDCWLTLLIEQVTSLNISRERPGCRHVIVVYLRDFLDESYVKRTEAELRSCGVVSSMTLTPDIYHRLGLYFRNEYHISPVYLRSRYCKKQSSSQSDCESSMTSLSLPHQSTEMEAVNDLC